MSSSTIVRLSTRLAYERNGCNGICVLHQNIHKIKSFSQMKLLRTFASSSIPTASGNPQEKINVFNLSLNIERVGTGSHPLLCLPGSLGCIESDFTPQLQKLNRELFTIVAWDPPGYGKSRPPNRDIVSGQQKTLSNDGILSHEIMKKLGHNKFSILGWSDGAITGLFMANMFPESIQKMVLFGGQAFVNEKDFNATTTPDKLVGQHDWIKKSTSGLYIWRLMEQMPIQIRDIDSWSEKMRKPLINMYGEEYLRKTCAAWMDGYIELYQNGGDICKDLLKTIKCPTFIIHGAKDVLVHYEHAEYLHKHIKNSKLFIMPEGKHNLHLRYPDEFNAMTETFLLK